MRTSLHSFSQSGNLTDAHALENSAPIVDECSQDWTLLSAEVGDDGLVFEAERSLETSDPQDRSLVDDTVEGISCEKAWYNKSDYGAESRSSLVPLCLTREFSTTDVLRYQGCAFTLRRLMFDEKSSIHLRRVQTVLLETCTVGVCGQRTTAISRIAGDT